MTSRDAALEVLKKLRESGFEAYFAGGCVRDRLIGRVPGDHDVATNAVPDAVQKLFRRTIAVGKQFGVIIVLVKDCEVEVATFRADAKYTDGRHPDSVTFSDMKSDVLRRDFTINGMMEDPLTGTIVDLVGGQPDIKARLIRAIGDPEKRFDEDRLRMLRAVRFAAQIDFEIESATLEAISRRSAEISSVSRERVKEELGKLLAATGAGRGLRLLRSSGLLAACVPALKALPEDRWAAAVATVEQLPRRDFGPALAALVLDTDTDPAKAARIADATARDLKCSNDERERAVWLVAHHRDPERASAMKASEWKPLLAHPGAADLLDLFRAVRLARGLPLDEYSLMAKRVQQGDLDPPRLFTGDDLLAMGAPRGPRIGEVLTAVRAAQLDGEVTTKEAAAAMARKMLGL
ncbi:MAG: CCA tRNA nucleotidyltransferase [Planctomycetes bacterium]|nr:CCA tRNA nucleotidyltransferase [Planctomycetota bacterium]